MERRSCLAGLIAGVTALLGRFRLFAAEPEAQRHATKISGRLSRDADIFAKCWNGLRSRSTLDEYGEVRDKQLSCLVQDAFVRWLNLYARDMHALREVVAAGPGRPGLLYTPTARCREDDKDTDFGRQVACDVQRLAWMFLRCGPRYRLYDPPKFFACREGTSLRFFVWMSVVDRGGEYLGRSQQLKEM